MPDRVFRTHLRLIAVLLGGHVFVNGAYLLFGHGRLLGLSEKLDFVQESSLPNFFAASALLATAAVAATIARVSSTRTSKLTACWSMATAVLVFLAFDEGAGIHDLLAVPVQRALNSDGVLFIGWVAPYAVLTLAVAYKLLPLARALSPGVRNQLVAAAGLYVSAAIGVEMMEAVLMDRSTQGGLGSVDFSAVNHAPAMMLMVTIEETAEMIGVALALRALLFHLTRELRVELFSATALPDVTAAPWSGQRDRRGSRETPHGATGLATVDS